MREQFTVEPQLVGTVVLTTVVMYLALIALVRFFGQRSLATISSFDVGCVVALGAVLGRTVLLENPTLMVGLVALFSLFAMSALLRLLRRSETVDRLLNRPPVLLMRDGVVITENMRKFRMVEPELRQAIRHAGLHSMQDVGSLVLEPNGTLSVISCAHPIDSWLLSDVTGRPAAATADAKGASRLGPASSPHHRTAQPRRLRRLR